MIEYDNRHLWMKLKRLIGSHFANYQEAWAANRLIAKGKIQPLLSAGVPPRRRRRGRLPGAPQPARGQDRRAVPGARRRPRHRRPRAAGPGRRGQDHAVPQPRRLAPAWLASHAERSSLTRQSIAADRDRPRRHRRHATSEAAIDYYREAFGAEVDHREVVESDGVEEALLKVADSYIQLLTPTRHDSPWPSPREAGRGPAPRRLPRRRLRRGAGGDDGRRGDADRRGAPTRQPGHDRRLRPPQGQLRHPDRARPGVARRAVQPSSTTVGPPSSRATRPTRTPTAVYGGRSRRRRAPGGVVPQQAAQRAGDHQDRRRCSSRRAAPRPANVRAATPSRRGPSGRLFVASSRSPRSRRRAAARPCRRRRATGRRADRRAHRRRATPGRGDEHRPDGTVRHGTRG